MARGRGGASGAVADSRGKQGSRAPARKTSGRAAPGPTPRDAAPPPGDAEPPFWTTKALEELDEAEWEALCDGCGRCCLNKLEDEDTGDIHLTRLACRLLDLGSCRCSDYPRRKERVPECVKIDAEAVRSVRWLPSTCAYRLVAEGRPLAWWHPLLSGTPDTVHDAGISVRGLARSERGVKIDDYWKFIIPDFG